MSVLDISNQRWSDATFEKILDGVTPVVKCIHVDLGTLTEKQKLVLSELTGRNHLKGLKIVDVGGGELPIHSNWEVYADQKEKAYKKGMHETTKKALTYFKGENGKNPDFVLDFGAGTGQDTVNLALEGCPKIWAVDGDEGSLAILRRNLDEVKHASQVTLINAPFITLEVAKQVDLLVSSYTWPYRCPNDFLACWDKCVSIVKEGGYISGHFFGPLTDKNRDPGMTYHTEDALDQLLKEKFDIVWFKKDREGSSFQVYGSNDTPEWGDLYHVVAKKREERQ